MGVDDDKRARDTFLGLFFDADRRDWKAVEAALADPILLDYSSSKGAAPQSLSPSAVVGGWLEFVPGFDSTHHHLTVVRSAGSQDDVRVEANGTTTHVLRAAGADRLWTVAGSYDARLRHAYGRWTIYSLTFHRSWSSGDERLYDLAVERVKKRSLTPGRGQ